MSTYKINLKEQTMYRLLANRQQFIPLGCVSR